MYSYRVIGGKPLKGEVNISGSKNAVLGILAAAMMLDGPCVLENVPDISDVHIMVDLCRKTYIQIVCDWSGLKRDEMIHFSDMSQMLRLVQAMAYVENGVLIDKKGSMAQGYALAS